MKLTELFVADLEREAAISRKVLAQVPEGLDDWKPHPKSMALGYLATLVAIMPSWIESIVDRDELDLGKGEAGPNVPATKLVEALDNAVARSRKSLENTTDDHLMTNWQLKVNGQTVAEAPRHVMIRDSVLQHVAHHRGQLSVYLRLNEAKVPAMYGPSADERF